MFEGFIDISASLKGGVYILVSKGKIIYIGKAKTLLSRVNAHRSQYSTKRRKGKVPDFLPIPGLLFDQIYIAPCHPDRVDALEKELIERFRPKYNTQLKPSGRVPLTTLMGLKPKQDEFVRRV